MKIQGLEALVHRFTDVFNQHDFEGALALFGETADVEGFDGQRGIGKAAIRSMLEPYFVGTYGRMHFDVIGIICDENKGEAWSSWRFVLTNHGVETSFRGVDVLRFVDGLITMNSVYVKSKTPLIE